MDEKKAQKKTKKGAKADTEGAPATNMEMVNFGGGAIHDDLGEESGESRREPNIIRKHHLRPFMTY